MAAAAAALIDIELATLQETRNAVRQAAIKVSWTSKALQLDAC